MKAALIGAGQIARQHLGCLRTLAGVEVAGVCDLSPASAECAADRYGIPRWFTDHRRLLDEVRPDVVHITTPVTSHYRLAADALDAGAHVLVEKPATPTFGELEDLLGRAEARGRWLVENQNYLYNPAPRRLLDLAAEGAFGRITHVEAMLCLNIHGAGSPFADPNVPHPSLSMPGGAIGDFLTHLATLACAFLGPHRAVRTVWAKRSPSSSPLPSDEFRALVDAESGTALLGLSSHSRPDGFWLRVYGEALQASANLYDARLTFQKAGGVPKPLLPTVNALRESWALRKAAVTSLVQKLDGGPAVYQGLWTLVEKLYQALADGGEPPVSRRQMIDVNRLVADLQDASFRF